MIKNIKRFFKDESGQITTTEVVILVAVIALLAGMFGNELKGVFTGGNTEGDDGAVGKLKGFIDGIFTEAIPEPKQG
jgi:Flp pilus assembly pilin Flp